MQDLKRTKLSKTVLDMKFMKKTKERVLKEEEDAEEQSLYANEITNEMKKGGNIIFVETSIFHCKDLIEGRLSYGGMNTDIEKYMQGNLASKYNDINAKKEKDVTDVEMAQSGLANTISKKFQTKKRHSYNHVNKKRKVKN